MYKLNLIAIVGIVAAVSFVAGMAAPAVFAQDNMTMNMKMDNMSSMTSGVGNSTTMNQTDNAPNDNLTR